MSAAEPECPLSELPPSQCACPRHRGGVAPGDEPVETAGQPFEAVYAGFCAAGCYVGIRPGDSIARVADGGYVHVEGCPR